MKVFFWYGVSILVFVCLLGVGISLVSSVGSASQVRANFEQQDVERQADKKTDVKKDSKKSAPSPATKKTFFETVGETLGIGDSKKVVEKNPFVSEQSSSGVPSFEKPAYLMPYTSSNNFEYSRGKLTLFVTADWTDEDKTLFWGNYNDTSYQDLFVVAGHNQTVSFTTYDHTQKSNTITADLGSDYHNRQFMIQIEWEFNGTVGRKKIWINGEMRQAADVSSFPSLQNSSMLVGPIDSIEISEH